MDSEKVIKRDNEYVLHTYNRNPIVLNGTLVGQKAVQAHRHEQGVLWQLRCRGQRGCH